MDIHSNYITAHPFSSLCKRGIIIIDTSTLISLNTEVPYELQITPHPNPLYLLQILPFLGRNGYQIIIPEMVAYEAAGVLNNGFTFAQYFAYEKSSTRIILRKFLVKPTNASYITIAPPIKRDKTKPAEFIRALHQIHNGSFSTNIKRNQFISLQREDKKNYGDIAAHKIIENMEPSDLPVFYLGDDIPSLRTAANIGSDVTVYPLTTWNFLEILSNINILPLVNIKAAHIFHFLEIISAQRNDSGMAYKNPKDLIDPSRKIFAESLDGIQKEESYNIADRVFDSTMHPSVRPTALDNFNKKFGMFSHALSKGCRL